MPPTVLPTAQDLVAWGHDTFLIMAWHGGRGICTQGVPVSLVGHWYPAPRDPETPDGGTRVDRTSPGRWLPGHQDRHLVNHPGLVFPAEGGGLEARGAHVEGADQPRQRRAQRGDLRGWR